MTKTTTETKTTLTQLSPEAQRVVEVCDANTTWYCELQDSYETEGDLDWVGETLNEDPDEVLTIGFREAREAAAYLATRDGWSDPN